MCSLWARELDQQSWTQWSLAELAKKRAPNGSVVFGTLDTVYVFYTSLRVAWKQNLLDDKNNLECWATAAATSCNVCCSWCKIAKVWRNTSKLVKSWKTKMQREEKEGLPKKYRISEVQNKEDNKLKSRVCHNVWKSQKKSHSRSLRSNSVTRQVSFSRTKIGGKKPKLICDILSNFQTMCYC